jgi:hypothetical protein
MRKKCSEIDYFLHNLSTYSNKEVIDTIVENTSHHHPIRMVFKFEHKAYKNESKNVQKIERKIKWEKVDKDLYMAMVQTIWLLVSLGFPLSLSKFCILISLF